MWLAAVGEMNPVSETTLSCIAVLQLLPVDFFVFARTAEILYDDFVNAIPSAGHGHPNACHLPPFAKGQADRLVPQPGIADLRLDIAPECFIRRPKTEVPIQGVRQSPRHNPATLPAEHDNHGQEIQAHRDMREVGAPDSLARPRDCHVL